MSGSLNQEKMRAARPWFKVMYVMLFQIALLSLVCLGFWTVYAPSNKAGGSTRPTGLQPITNKTYPNVVLKHFGPDAFATFDGQPYGVRDGYCKAYTNEVSWLVIECQGSVIQP